MIIKSFTSDTVAGALKRVRTELGGDAVILKTRKIDPAKQSANGDKVEVTACLDKPKANDTVIVSQPEVLVAEEMRRVDIPATVSTMAAEGAIPSEAIARKLDFLLDVLQMPIRKDAYGGTVGKIFTAMLRADFPEQMARMVSDRLADQLADDSSFEMAAAAAEEILFSQMPKRRETYVFKPGHKIVLVGPAGSGKTSLMSRLAGYLVVQKKIPITMTSLDQVKVSAPEELQTYADILDVDRFEMPREIDCTLLEREGRDKITFIDTPALNPRDKANITQYAEKLARIDASRVIGVFSSWCRTSDMFDMLRSYQSLGLTELAFTMTDQTERLGGMIAMAIQYGLPISILGTGRTAASIDMLPDYRRLIRTVFGSEEVR